MDIENCNHSGYIADKNNANSDLTNLKMNPLHINKIMACESHENKDDEGVMGSETVTSQEASIYDEDERIKLLLQQNDGLAKSASDESILDELECQEIQTASFDAPNLAYGNP